MSLQMFYFVDQAKFSVPLRDDAVLAILSKKYPQETDAVFGLDEPDGADDPQGVISLTDLVAAVEKLLSAFKDDPKLNPRRYVFDFDIIPGVPVEGDRQVCGVELPGQDKRYNLIGGIDQCLLEEFKPGPNALSDRKESLDIRDRAVLETVSHGQIKIRSTKKQSPIAADLRRLNRFLQSQSGETVTKQLME